MLFHQNSGSFEIVKNSKKACLIIHGFSGTPSQMKPLGITLAKHGFDVYAPLLSGHGTKPSALRNVKNKQWIKDVEKSFNHLKQIYSEVFVIGFSLGGLLSILLNKKYQPDKLVLISTPIKMYGAFLLNFIPFINYFKKTWSWKQEKHRLRNIYDIDYEYFPLKSLLEVKKISIKAERSLSSIHCPLLIIQSYYDETVKPISAEIIFNKASSLNKKIHWLYKSRHLCVLGKERNDIFEEIIEFIK